MADLAYFLQVIILEELYAAFLLLRGRPLFCGITIPETCKIRHSTIQEEQIRIGQCCLCVLGSIGFSTAHARRSDFHAELQRIM